MLSTNSRPTYKTHTVPSSKMTTIAYSTPSSTTKKKRRRTCSKKLKDELDAYCRQTIVLGFNSAKYDRNLIKTHLAKALHMHEPGKTFTVKRNNSYACLANETFKFLDITLYLAPSFSYAKFLKVFDVSENKGFFPYEWFDGVDKLNHPTLPSHDDFYSSLKECNISPEDYDYCQRVWSQNDMSTFRDFLVWYNNLDVGEFIDYDYRSSEYRQVKTPNGGGARYINAPKTWR
ncbi:unnamed protein product [Mytilus edulis]|uniref:Uncharacterized protein n=1 Tax=Mytilus edulis TaxID=6550 RepID=A0A8S3S8W3_MYTED|nr:unnamed protein product [Mytilus edulis]